MSANRKIQLPCVAVIGPFFNSAAHVKGWLNALSLQDYPHFKVYAIDDASDDDTNEWLQKTGRSIKFPFELISLTENVGPSAARNIAIKKALGDGADIILLLDSDCRVNPDWISRHVQFHLSQPDVAILGGAIQGKGHTPVGIADGFCSWFTAVPHADAGAVRRLHLSTTNMSLKANTFSHIGYFDEKLATGEDVAFCRKAQRAGLILWLQSDIVITHLDRNDLRSAQRHHYRWGLHSFTLSNQEQGGYYEFLKRLPSPWLALPLVPVIALLNVVLILTKYTPHQPKVWLYLPWICLLKWQNALGVYRGFLNPKLCLRS